MSPVPSPKIIPSPCKLERVPGYVHQARRGDVGPEKLLTIEHCQAHRAAAPQDFAALIDREPPSGPTRKQRAHLGSEAQCCRVLAQAPRETLGLEEFPARPVSRS